MKDKLVLNEVLRIRGGLPRIGTDKLYFKLDDFLQDHQITMERDYLYDLMRIYHLNLRRRKRYVCTTESHHRMYRYSNLVKDLVLTESETVWVADITYIRLPVKWSYLSLITDAYSKKIIGYCLRKDLSVTGCVEALEMAIANHQFPVQKLF